jgi:pimeloyl-ACP methyl ester carboxylesterase
MKLTTQLALFALVAACFGLSTFATIAQAQTVETGLVKLADSDIEYFSRGEGEAIVLLPGGTLTIGYLDGLAEELAKAPKPAALHALEVIFNPSSTDEDILALMPYLVSNPADSARVWARFKPSRDPAAGGIEKAAAEATPLTAWWAPPGKTKYLILQRAEDQIAPPENGVLLQKELGDRATLVNVPGAAHLLPLEQSETAASHIIDFIKQLGGKP